MADCPCTITPTTTGIAVTTGNVTFDGGATCTGFNSGNLNDYIEHATDLICALQASLAALSIDPADITTTGLIDPSCFTSPTYGDNLAAYINEIASILCGLEADLSSLVIADIGGTFDLSCINAGYAASTLQQAIDRLTVAVCSITGTGGGASQWLLDLLESDGAMALPLMPFAKDTVTITDISALGVAKVNIDATDYWINATALSMIGTNITPLVDSQDNYIFIDKDTAAYDWTAVAIGAAAPVTNGDKVAMVRTGVGTVTSITNLIGYSPIDSDILEDDSIDATKLTTTIATQPIENNGTNIVLNYDTDHLAVVANELTLATGAIDDVTLIDAAAVLDPSIEVSGGKLQAGVQYSVALDAITGKIELEGDVLTVNEWSYYGTDKTSNNRGFHNIYNRYEDFTIPSASILSLNALPYQISINVPVGWHYSVDKIVVKIPDAGTDYVSANALEFRYTDGSGTKVTADVPNTFLQSSARQVYVAHGIDSVVTSAAPIVAYVPVADPTTGTKDITGRIYYTIEYMVG